MEEKCKNRDMRYDNWMDIAMDSISVKTPRQKRISADCRSSDGSVFAMAIFQVRSSFGNPN